MSALRFWWVRHAPTGRRGAIGWTDAPADFSDAAAFARLSALLPEPAALVSSDLSRAKGTADRVAGPGRRRMRDDPALRELHFGDWEGLDFAEAERGWPEAHAAFWAAQGPAAAPGGESLDALAARVDGAIDRLVAEIGAGDVVVVAHMGAVMMALRRALGLTPAQATAFQIAPLSVTRLDWLPEPGAWRVAQVNRTP